MFALYCFIQIIPFLRKTTNVTSKARVANDIERARHWLIYTDSKAGVSEPQDNDFQVTIF